MVHLVLWIDYELIALSMCIYFIHIELLRQWLWYQPVDVSSLRFYHLKIIVSIFALFLLYLPYLELIISLVY